MKRFIRDAKGQAMVELALILPILLLLVFGITEFGRIFGTHLILTHSAREGARAATVGATDLQIITEVQNSSAVLDSTKLTINISPSEASRKRGEAVTVKVQYPVKIYAPIISNIVGDPYVANGEAVMRME
jgi:Flp pilus assembly protein TadG